MSIKSSSACAVRTIVTCACSPTGLGGGGRAAPRLFLDLIDRLEPTGAAGDALIPKLAKLFGARFQNRAPLLPATQGIADHLACGRVFAGVHGLLQQRHEFGCESDAHFLHVRHGSPFLPPW